jgi:Zn-dependent protease with chaperone function/Tfp pilus assembly major pilin PilA
MTGRYSNVVKYCRPFCSFRSFIMTSPSLVGSLSATPVAAYRHEKTLFGILAAISVLFWLLLTVGTFGTVWLYMLLMYLFALFAHSALISYLQGNAVRIGATQFPDLHERLQRCASRLDVDLPEAFLMTGDGMLNAFATRFLRRYYVVLLSDVVDALEDDPEAINFYIGHELGHIDRKHIANGWWMAPAMLLPLIGAAYRRAQEYTCDQYGLACCADQGSAARALAVLAAGTRRWKSLDAAAYVAQCDRTGGFWMSLNELASDYPWLCKRMAHLQDAVPQLPSRHPLAWVLALFMPRIGGGGPLFGIIMLFALIGILAAVALPAYQDYVNRAAALPAFSYGDQITQATGSYILEHREIPADLSVLGIAAPGSGVQGSIDGESAIITLTLKGDQTITYSPTMDDEGDLYWSCETTLAANALPMATECESLAETGGGLGGLLGRMR